MAHGVDRSLLARWQAHLFLGRRSAQRPCQPPWLALRFQRIQPRGTSPRALEPAAALRQGSPHRVRGLKCQTATSGAAQRLQRQLRPRLARHLRSRCRKRLRQWTSSLASSDKGRLSHWGTVRGHPRTLLQTNHPTRFERPSRRWPRSARKWTRSTRRSWMRSVASRS